MTEEFKRLYFASLLDLRNGISLKQVTEKSLELYLKMTASFGQYLKIKPFVSAGSNFQIIIDQGDDCSLWIKIT